MDYSRTKYRAPIDFLIDTTIREFDVSKANISVLLDSGVINNSLYEELYNLPKRQREIYVGTMQGRNPNVTKALKDGLAYARRIFIEGNGISDEEILSIDNDSITIIGSKPIVVLTVMPHVTFRMDGRYTSYFGITPTTQRFDYLYGYNKITGEESFKVKGLGHAEPFHKPYMLDFLCELFKCLQVEGPESAMMLLNMFHRSYVQLELDIGYYRRLDQTGMYDIGAIRSEYANFQANALGTIGKHDIDISFNETVLRCFQAILTSYYFQKRG